MMVPSPAYLKGISIFGPGVNISFLPGLAVLVVECGVHLRVGVSGDVAGVGVGDEDDIVGEISSDLYRLLVCDIEKSKLLSF